MCELALGMGSLQRTVLRSKDKGGNRADWHGGSTVCRFIKFIYKGDNITRIGFMADEVEKVHPDAVFDVGGIKAVDYALAVRPV